MNTKICPACKNPIPASAPGGLCPACILRDAEAPAPADRTAPSLAEIAAAFPQLEILGLIGQGGMGWVFKARQPKLNRLVALKLLPASLAERDAAFAGRFEREGQLLARLHHPNIVAVHDSGISQPSTLNSQPFFYLLMEFVDGVNLRQAMRSSRFTPAQALAIVPHICDALQFAHDEGVLHRDIKPENILLDAKGRVKLADFGIAKLIESNADTLVRSASEPELAKLRTGVSALPGLTQSGTTLGTPSYMAPEQRDTPADVDNRADIYSLGVVFYELLTGELPTGSIAQPSAKCDADPRVDAIVQQALEKERTRRQHSASEVKTQVETLSQPGTHPKSVTNPPHPIQPTLILHLTLFALVAALFFIVVPRFAAIYREMGLPRPAMARIGYRATVTGMLLFPVLLGLDVGLCFLARKLGGKRGLRQWTIAVIVGLVSVVAMSSVSLMVPLQKLVTNLGPKPTVPFLEWAQGEWTLDRDESERATATLYPGGQDNSPGTAALREEWKPFIVASHVSFSPTRFEFWEVRNPSVPLPQFSFTSGRAPLPESAKSASPDQFTFTAKKEFFSHGSTTPYKVEEIPMGPFSKTKDGLLQWTMEKPGGVKYALVFRRTASKSIEGDPGLGDAFFSALRPTVGHDWKTDPEIAADADKNWNPWAGHIKNGDMLRMRGDLPGALQSYQASIDAAVAESKKQEPEEPKSRDWQRGRWQSHTAQSQTKLGDVQSALGELDAALKSYRESVALLDALLASEPGNAERRTQLCTAFVKVGDVLRAQGNAAEAMKSYRSGVVVFEKLPKVNEWEFVYGSTDGGSYDPSEPFDAQELPRLVVAPSAESVSKKNARQSRMFCLINRAGAEKAAQFRTLISNQELLKEPMLGLALAGYDYSVNGSQKALDFILTKLAAEPVGSDSNESVVLAFVDEWDRTVSAVESHFTATDGAGGFNHAAFWETRQFLFPRSYLLHRLKTLEGAPVKADGNATATAVEKESPPAKPMPDVESWSYTLRHLDAERLDKQMKAKPQAGVATKVEAGVVTLTGPRDAVRPLATMLRVLDQPEVKDPFDLPLFNMPPDFFTRLAIPGLMSGMEFKDTQFEPVFFETLKRAGVTAPQLARALSAHVLELEKATFVNTGTPFESIMKTPGASTYYDGTIPCADQPDKPLTLRIRRTTQQMGTKPDIAGLAPWLIEEAKKHAKEPLVAPGKDDAKGRATEPPATPAPDAKPEAKAPSQQEGATLAQQAAQLAATKGKAWKSEVLELRRANGAQYKSILILEFAPFAGFRENPPDASVKVSGASPAEGPFKVSVGIADPDFRDVRLKEKDGVRTIKITQAIETVDKPTKKTERILNDYRSMSFSYLLTPDTLTLQGFPTDEITWGSMGFIAPTRDIVFKLEP